MDDNKPKITPQIDTKGAVDNIRVLMKEVKRLKSEMAGLEEGSDEWNKLAAQAGEYQHQILAVGESVRGASSDFGDMLGNAAKVGSAITGAFLTAKAAMSLFGIESEEVTKSIQKMQNLMAITLGLSSIDAGIKSLKKLSAAIKGTTVAAKALKAALQPKVFLAITAAIAVVTLAYEKMKGNQEAAKKAQEDLEKAITESNVRMAKSYDNLNKAIGKLGTTSKTVLQAEYNRAEYQFSKIAKTKYGWTDKEVKAFEGYIKAYNEAIREAYKATTEEDAKAAMMSASSWMKVIGTAVSGKDDLLSWGNQLLSLDESIALAENDLSKSTDKSNKSMEDKLALYTLIAGQNISKMSLLSPVAVEEQEEVDENEEKRLAQQAKYYHDVETMADQAKKIVIKTQEEQFDYEQQLLDSALNLKLLSQEEYTNACNDLAKRKSEYEIEQEELAAEKKRKLVSSVVAVTTESIYTIGDLFSGLADLQDTTSKAGFEQNKKLQIASATMSMLAGVTTALAGTFTTKSGPWDIALAAVQAAGILTSGLINIAKIKKTKFDGGSTSASISSSASNSIIAPVQYSQAVQTAELQSSLADTRVYVTETDIRSTSSRVNVIENENRY